jgi:hypothetical protein
VHAIVSLLVAQTVAGVGAIPLDGRSGSCGITAGDQHTCSHQRGFARCWGSSSDGEWNL